MANPFLDPHAVTDLYCDPARLSQRTSALRQAKLAGPEVAETICDLLAGSIGANSRVIDVGCGRGSTTINLAQRFRPHELIALDASQAVLDVALQRFTATGVEARTQLADFHRMPFPSSSTDAVVAAFCLYHSPNPTKAIGEFVRILRPGAVAVLVTKSADSYSELDRLVVESGLDEQAARRPSLYESFHSTNIAALASAHLNVTKVIHERHLFRFHDFHHLAAYLTTTPKYCLNTSAEAVSARLRRWRPNHQVTASSTVSYLLGAAP